MSNINNIRISHCPECLDNALSGIPCPCNFEEELRKQADDDWNQEDVRFRIEQLRNDGLPYPKYRQWTFDRDDLRNPEITNTCKAYVEEWPIYRADGKGIVFMGDTGTGKSFHAGCIANDQINKNIPVLMSGFRRIIDKLFDAGYGAKRTKFFEELHKYELLVLEDVGVERDTAYVSEQFYYIVDEWYLSGKPLIITTNLDSNKLLTDELDYKRSFDRILENSILIPMTGDSRRLEIAERNHKKYKDSLEL